MKILSDSEQVSDQVKTNSEKEKMKFAILLFVNFVFLFWFYQIQNSSLIEYLTIPNTKVVPAETLKNESKCVKDELLKGHFSDNQNKTVDYLDLKKARSRCEDPDLKPAQKKALIDN